MFIDNINDDKTEFLILGTKQQLAKVNIDNTMETLDHGLIHSSLCLVISVSFVPLHFTTFMLEKLQ